MKTSKGFTLIELVVVIVILGILAATALPKFVDLGKDARIAKLNSLRATLQSTADLWHGIALARGCQATSWMVLTSNGVSANITKCYPNAGDGWGKDIEDLVQTTGFTISLSNGKTRFAVSDAPDPSTCFVDYGEASNYGDTPSIPSPTITGC